MYIEIKTDRLLIRPITIADKGFIFELVNTKGWLQFIGDRKIHDETSAEIYIQNILANENFFYSVIEHNEIKSPIGIITFLYRDNLQCPYIGFAMLPNFENKGYAFEATNAYLENISSEIKDNKILAITLPDNTASIKLIKKLGLLYENKIENKSEILHVYSLKLNK
jgi:RimJ/RimL family protein N-acetyltransferase